MSLSDLTRPPAQPSDVSLSVVDAVRNGRSRNIPINDILIRITDLAHSLSISLDVRYVSTDDNIADRPSRGLDLPGEHLPSIQLNSACLAELDGW